MIQTIGKKWIAKAVQENAQDIYLIPKKDSYQLFIRIGNQRQWQADMTVDDATALIGHFKFLAGMAVGEKRRAQLGSCDYDYGGEKSASLRLSSVGDYRGLESLVIRLLFDGYRQLHYHFNALDELLPKIKERGLYLFAGPVGSGKTTLMYQLVKEKFPQAQVITIEDPVEIKEDSMLQLQVNDSIGSSYDNLIKLSLRHRPDILIIGEIRDTQTARAVIRASLTGATVFSTVHAKSIPGVYARLLELGLSQEEVIHSLRAIVYQRLIDGGGVIDIATENFETHKAIRWNQKMDNLVEHGHLTIQEALIEKIASS